MLMDIKIETDEQTLGGRAITGTIPVVDLAKIPAREFPGCPWNKQESTARFQQSIQHGHWVVLFKCGHCSLEFQLFTWRDEIELLETYQPTHAKNGGLCKNVSCPECGTKQCFMLKYLHTNGTIFANADITIKVVQNN